MSFSEQLLAESAELLARQQDHPFVRGLGDGTLPEACFRTWLRQDDRYLELYAQALALAAENVSRPEDRQSWQDALRLTLEVEIPGHHELAARLGLTPEDLAATPVHPVTLGYGDFLIEVARGSSQARVLASHLPCAHDYSHLGRMLLSRGLPEQPLYATWIRSYADPAFHDLALRLAADLDRHVAALDAPSRTEVARIFSRARSYEIAFWDMCWDRVSP